MTGNPKRRQRDTLHPGDIPAAFRGTWRGDDDAAARLWADHRQAPTDATLDALARFYLPLCWLVAAIWYRRLRSRLSAERPMDDVLSDCTLGLVVAIADDDGERTPARFAQFARAVMKRRVFCGLSADQDWSWHARIRHAHEARKSVIRSFRRKVAREQGRAATRQDIAAHLASMIDNPAIQVGDAAPPMLSLSADVGDGRSQQLPAPQPPLPELHDTRALRVAMRQLAPADRVLLKAILRGESSAAVGESLGISRKAARRRMNGLLWELRRRRDLAEALGLEPEAEAPKPPGACRPRTCAGCGGPFTLGGGGRLYCSDGCRRRGRAGRGKLAV